MKRSIPLLVLAFASLAFLAEAEPAEARGRWWIGGDFHVGPAHFSLTYFGPHHRYYGHHHRGHYSYPRHRYYRYDHHPGYYYRTRHRLHYRGHDCGSYCFRKRGYDYHHESCSLVGHHFRRYDYHPERHHRGYRGDGPHGYDRGYWRHYRHGH